MATERLMGTYEWCEAERKALSWAEKLALVKMLVLAELRDRIERSPFGSSMRRRAHSIAASVELGPPDSKLCSDARACADAKLSEPLLLHSLRTYQFGVALAAVDQHSVDRELLFVASMFHDFGLAPEDRSTLGATCFATEGAREGAAFVRKQGLDSRRERAVYEAISLHLHPRIDVSSHGAEARYLADGATLDVIGARRHLLPEPVLAEVHSAFPRRGFRDEILSGMRVPHAPGTRAAFLLGLGFASLAAKCPLDETP